MSSEITLVAPILYELASEFGFELILEPDYRHAGRIITRKGKVIFFHNTHFDINPLGASEIATDKTYAAYFMKLLGYPTPEGRSFYSDEWCKKIQSNRNTMAAIQYANAQGFPLIVKPNSKSQGQGVEIVYTIRELKRALQYSFEVLRDRVTLVQEIVGGSDYRIVVLDKEVLCAYRRTPLSIVGNGKSSVQELLYKKQAEFIKRGRDTTISIEDPRMHRKLRRLRLGLTSIVPKGLRVQLLDTANLSSGGEAEDVTKILHTDYRKMAVSLAHDMALKFCGIDIMTPHAIGQKPRDYTVIEINAAPGLDYYAGAGEAQKEIVKSLYKKMLIHMPHI
jgi:D-alanine-D-alanine ligase-like ATP-grasp enzyme